MRRRGPLFLALFVGCPQLVAAQNCLKEDYGTVCLETVENDKDGSVTISAHNRETYEVTITVNAKLKNMTSSVNLPYTRALEGGFRQPILKFLPNSRGQAEWEYSWDWIVGSRDARHDDSVVYDLPYRGRYTVLQGFHGTFTHTGENEYAVDWDMPVGTAVHAAREGTVVAVRSTNNKAGADEKYAEFSNFVWIRHPDGTIGSYEHLKQGGVVVKGGHVVSRKQLIGYSGNTGWTSRSHLHFSVTRPVDGVKYQSFPMRFRTTAGIINPVEGRAYTSLVDNRPGAVEAHQPLSAKTHVVECTRLTFRQIADTCNNCTAPPWNGELKRTAGDEWTGTYIDGNNRPGSTHWRLTSQSASEVLLHDGSRDLYVRFDLPARKGFLRRGRGGNWINASEILSTDCR